MLQMIWASITNHWAVTLEVQLGNYYYSYTAVPWGVPDLQAIYKLFTVQENRALASRVKNL